ncbi:MAG: FimB/Mfa2 family fimbrial subunit [Prevotella sp.]|nr:FimB/Mfa2 family fimbrial subunit [Prevotella sp.]
MEKRRLHISCWLLAVSFWLLAVGCSSSDGTEEPQPTMLTIYVYSPEHPMLIRSAIGPVNPTLAESTVHRLQIWIFESLTGRLVGYLDTTETENSLLNINEGATYQMIVSDEFAKNKPKVDVYVFANVTGANCGCAFNENSTPDQLNAARIEPGYFGLSPLFDAEWIAHKDLSHSLPMTGVLRNQPVVGDAPALRVGTLDRVATVSLTRAVSKVRFVFANTTGAPALTIKDIQMYEGMIPNTEYLIPQDQSLSYNSSSESLLPSQSPIGPVESINDPTAYIYDGQDGQTYENRINNANLTVVGPFYLRESDKRLKGKIIYKIGDGSDQESEYQMNEAGDFQRNHSWIVYAYHAGGGFLQMNALYVKEWINEEVNHAVYNW